MTTEETKQPAVVLSTALLGAVPLFVVVRDMNYTGEILFGKWDGTHYVLDDGDCYTPERLADEYDVTFSDTEPNAELRGASRLHGEASLSNDVLGAQRPGKD